jgi:hypothetical protein
MTVALQYATFVLHTDILSARLLIAIVDENDSQETDSGERRLANSHGVTLLTEVLHSHPCALGNANFRCPL